MKKTSIILCSLVVVAVVSLAFLLLGGCYLMSTYNEEAKLNNLYNMKIKANEADFDNMWKTISQVCQLADSKKDAFKEIFTSYATAATPQDGGKMMLWLKQAAPNMDLSVYDKAQNVIVGTRDGWTMRQKELVSIASTYNENLAVQPRGFILNMFGFKVIDPKVITSTRTETAFQTGKDDDVKIK